MPQTTIKTVAQTLIQVFNNTPENSKTFHFIAIGGIGMSGIAQVLAEAGFSVQGSDISTSANTQRLQGLGVKVFNGHAAENVTGADVVIVSTAIKPDNPELMAAKEQGKTIIHRSEMLGEICKNFKTIAITGTHGKTSTTAMVYQALKEAGLDVGVINGGIIPSLNSNAKIGGEWLVVEADESDGSLVNIPAFISVITNIEPEHMEHHGTFDKLLGVYKTFLNNTHPDGFSVLCADDVHVQRLAKEAKPAVVWYGKSHGFENITLNIPGRHNVLNAQVALKIGDKLGLDKDKVLAGLGHYTGVMRRFTLVGQVNGVDIIDDYAHHPTEIAATIDAALEKYKSVVAVIQPHRYSRLHALMDGFAASPKKAACVYVAPVHAAGEDVIDGADHLTLKNKMAQALSCPVEVVESVADLQTKLDTTQFSGGAVLFMGAGSITQWAKDFFNQSNALKS